MQEIYSQVVPQAPYIIGAYALIWAALLGYVAVVFSRLRRVEREIEVLEDAVARRAEKKA